MHYIVILLVFGILAFGVWYLVSTRQGPDQPGRGRRDAPRGPDDDPDFLRDLDRKHRPR